MQLEQWSYYWSSGCITSLPQDFNENYDGEILNFWHKEFSAQDNNASILDVCTGNGAIAIMAQEYSLKYQKSFNINAVDGSEVNLDAIVRSFPKFKSVIEKIKFESNVMLEDMELEQSNFDLITSQYGIEYSDWPKSARAIYQHLKVGGHFSIITHAPTTDITKYMEQELSEYNSIQRIGLFDDINKYLTGKLTFMTFTKRIKQNLLSIKRKYKFNISPLIKGFIQFCQYTLNCEEHKFKSEVATLEGYYNNHWFAFQRLGDVLAVSQRIEDNPNWFECFLKEGLELTDTFEIMYGGQNRAGIAYRFIKK